MLRMLLFLVLIVASNTLLWSQPILQQQVLDELAQMMDLDISSVAQGDHVALQEVFADAGYDSFAQITDMEKGLKGSVFIELLRNIIEVKEIKMIQGQPLDSVESFLQDTLKLDNLSDFMNQELSEAQFHDIMRVLVLVDDRAEGYHSPNVLEGFKGDPHHYPLFFMNLDGIEEDVVPPEAPVEEAEDCDTLPEYYACMTHQGLLHQGDHLLDTDHLKIGWSLRYELSEERSCSYATGFEAHLTNEEYLENFESSELIRLKDGGRLFYTPRENSVFEYIRVAGYETPDAQLSSEGALFTGVVMGHDVDGDVLRGIYEYKVDDLSGDLSPVEVIVHVYEQNMKGQWVLVNTMDADDLAAGNFELQLLGRGGTEMNGILGCSPDEETLLFLGSQSTMTGFYADYETTEESLDQQQIKAGAVSVSDTGVLAPEDRELWIAPLDPEDHGLVIVNEEGQNTQVTLGSYEYSVWGRWDNDFGLNQNVDGQSYFAMGYRTLESDLPRNTVATYKGEGQGSRTLNDVRTDKVTLTHTTTIDFRTNQMSSEIEVLDDGVEWSKLTAVGDLDRGAEIQIFTENVTGTNGVEQGALAMQINGPGGEEVVGVVYAAKPNDDFIEASFAGKQE